MASCLPKSSVIYYNYTSLGRKQVCALLEQSEQKAPLRKLRNL